MLLDRELLGRQTYADGFWYAMIGFGAAIVDVSLNGLDLLPDPLGYGIVAYGAVHLRRLHGWATHALTIAVGLALIAAMRLLALLNDIRYADSSLGRTMELVEAAGLVVVLWIFYQIMIELAVSANAAGFAREAHTYRLFVAVVVGAAAALGALTGATTVEASLTRDVELVALALFLAFAFGAFLVVRSFLQASNLCRYGRLRPPRGSGLFPPRR